MRFRRLPFATAAPGILHEHAAAQPEKAPGGRMILLTLAGEIA